MSIWQAYFPDGLVQPPTRVKSISKQSFVLRVRNLRQPVKMMSPPPKAPFGPQNLCAKFLDMSVLGLNMRQQREDCKIAKFGEHLCIRDINMYIYTYVTHRIHAGCIFTDMNGWCLWYMYVNVGKYASPMDLLSIFSIFMYIYFYIWIGACLNAVTVRN